MYLRIKEFGDMVVQANRLGAKDVILDRNRAVELMSEISKLLVDRVDQLDKPVTKPTISALTGGYFPKKP